MVSQQIINNAIQAFKDRKIEIDILQNVLYWEKKQAIILGDGTIVISEKIFYPTCDICKKELHFNKNDPHYNPDDDFHYQRYHEDIQTTQTKKTKSKSIKQLQEELNKLTQKRNELLKLLSDSK